MFNNLIKNIFCMLPVFFIIFSSQAVPTHAIPEYQLDVAVECDSPSAATDADLKILPLPPGKNVAFSCRWDDSNFRNMKMKKLMTLYGYKGTFYLCRFNPKFNAEVMPELCKDGCTIGNHTMNHLPMPLLTANGIHYEILQLRILYEDASNQTINAFIFPFGKYTSQFDPQVPHIFASALRRSGMLGGADTPAYRLGQLPGNEFFSTKGCNVSPGDRNTSTERFDSHVKKFMPQPGKTVHMTLGVHVWHSDADFLKLEESLKKYAHRPDWWYCNENEFNAYSYMTKHVKVVKKSVRGNTAVFTLNFPCPEFLGSAVPLWAECGGKNIEIRHTRKLPALISLANAEGAAAKFPGLSAKISYTAADKVRLDIDNQGAELTDVKILWRLPTDFTEETLYCAVDSIKGKFSREWRVTPNPAWKSHGRQLTAVQIDFTRSNAGGRVWASLLREIQPENPFGVKFRCVGKTLDDKQIAQLAQPGAKIKGIKLIPVQQDINYREWAFMIPYKARSKDGMTAVMDFNGGRKMTLSTDLPAGSRIYCNGKLLDSAKGAVTFDAPAGKCRILIQSGKTKSPVQSVQLFLTPAER